MTTESQLHKQMSKHKPAGTTLERIENIASSGIPDSVYTANGRDYWFELKIVKGGKIYLRPVQYNWMNTRIKLKAHSNVFVVTNEPARYRALTIVKTAIFNPGTQLYEVNVKHITPVGEKTWDSIFNLEES